jgi:hypothetical protein
MTGETKHERSMEDIKMFNITRTGKYLYATAPEGSVIESSVYYTKGGSNYFSGSQVRRGVFIDFNPTKIEKRDGYSTRTIELFSGKGIKFFVLPLKAGNAKRLQLVADFFSPHIAALAAEYATDPQSTIKKVSALVEEFKTKNAKLYPAAVAAAV